MIKSRNSLKAKASNFSKISKIPNMYIIQSFMFEALLKRLSKSTYKDNFIIKGGFLLSSIFGINLRSTMDLDATIRGISLNKETITKIINEIIQINIHDNVTFELERIKEIRIEENYPGYNVNLKGEFDGLRTNLLIDITTGEVITFKAVEFNYITLLDKEQINILTYNYETIIAEKFESIISRNIDNTRMKDFYDLYMFVKLKWNEINIETLQQAIKNTSKNRNTYDQIKQSKEYIKLIEIDNVLISLWDNYQKNYEYAEGIPYSEIIKALKKVNSYIKTD